MKAVEFEALMEETFTAIRKMNATKGRDYATEDDALAHVREQSRELGLDPEMIWAVLARKHWIAIVSYCKLGQVHSESIESRLHDLILYCIILLALSRETDAAE